MRTSGPGLLEKLTANPLIRAMNFHANRLGDFHFCIIDEVCKIDHLDEAYSHNSS